MGTTVQRRVAAQSSGWARVAVLSPDGRPADEQPVGEFHAWLTQTAPKGWSYEAPHLKLIASERQAMADGEVDRLIIMMPPRHAKTETGTIRYLLWRLSKDPTLRILVMVHTQELANRLGRMTRKLARRYLRLSRESSAMAEFETLQGGLVMFRGMASPPTGTGFNIILIDDPIKTRKQAESKLFRDTIWDAYNDDILTRLEPGGELSITATRWHEDDLTGRVLDSKDASNWRVIRLPAIAEEDDPLGRAPGEALWPERYDLAALNRIMEGRDRESEVTDRYSWEALYQQNPTPRQGKMFQVDKIVVVDAVPGGLRHCRSWDLANSKDGDFTCGWRLAGPDREGLWYMVGRVKGKWESATRNRIIRQTAEVVDGPSVLITVPRDPGPGGKESASSLVKLLAGYAVSEVAANRSRGDKENAATPFSAQVNAGNVRIVRSPTNAETFEELRQFPGGKNDDEVDGLADAFNKLANVPAPARSEVGVKAGGVKVR